MLKKENISDDGGEGSGDNDGTNNWARMCDTCRAVACTVYCKADSAYLCASCDARIHAANRMASRHERVWVCDACERSPATFLCKADAASLCSECDASIHSANPLARRHQRVPILPISGDLYGPHASVCETNEDLFITENGEEEEEEEDETASWLLLNPAKKNNNNQNNNNNGFLFGGEVDEYLDLVEYNSNSFPENQYTDNHNQQYNYKNYGSDESVVPVQCEEAAIDQIHPQYHNFQLGLEFESTKPSYTFNGSINHGVPISSVEVGMVPDPTRDEVSISHPRPSKGTIDLFSSPGLMQMSSLLSPRDREARVLRYREKKKTRKFEKTIRYASRKAYAETRPRIKGRFAKRTHPDQVKVDRMFSTTLITDTGYGVVPQF